MRAALAGAIALVAWAAPAQATTLPPLDLAPGQNAVAAGYGPWGGDHVFTFGFDRGLAPGFSVGAVLFRDQPVVADGKTLFAVRGAWMQSDYAGLMLSAGGGNSIWSRGVVEGFVQAAGVLRAGLGPVTLRLSVGPALVGMLRTEPRGGGMTYFDPTPQDGHATLAVIPLVLNGELAVRVWAGHELVAGGYSIVGYRARF